MKFRLSINKSMINKANPSLYGWRNAEMEGEDLMDHIQSGFAFSPGILKPGAKGTKPGIKDIECAQVLAVDIDNDIKAYNPATKKYDKRMKTKEEGYLSYEDAISDTFLRENALLVYTTPSHKDNFHRLRIVFVLDNPITNLADFRDAITMLIEKFGGDKSCSNIDRLFFGNRDCRMEFFGNIYSNTLSTIQKLSYE